MTWFSEWQRAYPAYLAACKEREDEEFERDVAAPQRAYLAFLADRGKRSRAPRPAKWERDLALTIEFDDGP